MLRERLGKGDRDHNMPRKVDHIGVAVHDVVDAARFYRDGLGLSVSEPEINPSERIKIILVSLDHTLIELMEPLEADTVVGKFLDTRGEGLHHICLKVDDVEEIVRSVVAHGAQLVDEQPRTDLHGRKLVFVHPKSANGVLVELVQDTEKDIEKSGK
ncbi:MAG: methylmalonyl-CoA epimerase [Chloroflexi bacterium]|nr:methylmalonyl-CoA epimerase [Chloroflexota bacterium]